MNHPDTKDDNGFGNRVGQCLICASILLALLLAFFRTGWYVPPYSELLFATLLLFAVLAPVPAIIGTILVVARRKPSWAITTSAGLATIGASFAFGFVCCLGSPTGVSFDETQGYEIQQGDILFVQDIYDPDCSATADSATLKAVVSSLEFATRIWQDGSEYKFECRIERNGVVVHRFDAMSSGNLIVDERLYQGPSAFGEFLSHNFDSE